MGRPLRARLDMDSRRAQLLDLGLQLFGTRPYDEVSIDDIARAANASKGLLYHYFGGKRAFYVAVVRDAARRLVEALGADPRLPPPQRLQAGLAAYLGFVEQRADAYAALVTGGLGADPEISTIVESTRRAIVDSLLTDVGVDAPRPVYRLALRGWIGAVEASCVDWLRHGEVSREQLLQIMMGSLQGTLATAYAIDPVPALMVPIPRLEAPDLEPAPSQPGLSHRPTGS